MTVTSFKTTKKDKILIDKIIKRANEIYNSHHGESLPMPDTEMDIIAVHLNGAPLDLEKLLQAPDFDLIHDIVGISNHIDRNTGNLLDNFWPRCSKPAATTKP